MAAVMEEIPYDEKRNAKVASPATSLDDEKKSLGDVENVKEVNNSDDSLATAGDDDDPAYNVLPQIVREICDFDDDPTMPVLTFRFFVISAIFTALGAWLTQMGFFRTTYIPYSIYFVQIASLYVGRFMARVLPSKRVGYGRFSFELNPGEFSIKEHVAVVLAANTGATNNLGDYVLAPLQVFYNEPMNGWLAILFMWSAVFIGFSYASFARVFLIENPSIPFPLTLQQAAVFKAMRSSVIGDSSTARRQMRVFWSTIIIFFCWQFLPEYAFPFTSSLALLCWFSKNPTTQFLGSGLGGAGILNITLDWSNIGSTMIYYPYWAQLNYVAACIITAWILIPIGFTKGIWGSDIYPIQTQTLYLRNGSVYPTQELLINGGDLNEVLFDEIGPPMMSAQLRWQYFFSYVAYIGSFVSCMLFQGPQLWSVFRQQWKSGRVYNDKLTQLARVYPQVPLWWNLVLFGVSAAVLIVLTATGVLYMPIYMLFIGLAIGGLIVLPMGFIYAVSGYQMQVGYFNELFYGYAIDAGGTRHPIGSLSYRVISGQCWYEAQSMLSDMKLGHFFHIPPRATLMAQVWGIIVGVPVNYATILWVCNTKGGILTGAITDPNRQWTGQTVISLYNQSISFALIGPRRLFDDPVYTPMLYGFLIGAVVPFILYGLHRLRPKWRFDLWSVPIFGDRCEHFWGNISNSFFVWFILGTLNHMYFKRYRYNFWKKYAYLWGAAADTGYNFNMLIIFIAFSAVKTISMPNWWGNNAVSVERCFYVPEGSLHMQ